MSKCIAAYTNPGTDYPGFINFSREDDGSISVHARGNPTKRDGECAHANCGETIHLTLSEEAFTAFVAEAAGVKQLRELLSACRARIAAQTNVGIVSSDPENENPQHELQELLPDIDDVLGMRS